jgi:hypothetical protein
MRDDYFMTLHESLRLYRLLLNDTASLVMIECHLDVVCMKLYEVSEAGAVFVKTQNEKAPTL